MTRHAIFYSAIFIIAASFFGIVYFSSNTAKAQEVCECDRGTSVGASNKEQCDVAGCTRISGGQWNANTNECNCGLGASTREGVDTREECQRDGCEHLEAGIWRVPAGGACQCEGTNVPTGARDEETCQAGGCLQLTGGLWGDGTCTCNAGVDVRGGADTKEECERDGCQRSVAGTWSAEGGDQAAAPSIPRLVNPLGVGITVQTVIGRVIKAVLGISGSLALAVFVWGGFMWLTSGGNTDKIEKGKKLLVWATLGLALIFGAYAITDFVIKAITGATGT